MPATVAVPPTLLFDLAPLWGAEEGPSAEASPSLPEKAKSTENAKPSKGTQPVGYLLGAVPTFLMTFVLAFALQLRHIHPALPGGDSGELMACCRWLLLAHPPGYPLYITLCHYVSRAAVAAAEALGGHALGPLERALFSSSQGGDGTRGDAEASMMSSYLWVYSMHAVSALFHAAAAGILAAAILRAATGMGLLTRPNATSDEGGGATAERSAGTPTTSLRSAASSSRKQTHSSEGRLVVTPTPDGAARTATIPTRPCDGQVAAALLQCAAVASGVLWSTLGGVSLYGGQVEVFALNNLFVAALLYLWVREEASHALNVSTRRGGGVWGVPPVVALPFRGGSLAGGTAGSGRLLPFSQYLTHWRRKRGQEHSSTCGDEGYADGEAQPPPQSLVSNPLLPSPPANGTADGRGGAILASPVFPPLSRGASIECFADPSFDPSSGDVGVDGPVSRQLSMGPSAFPLPYFSAAPQSGTPLHATENGDSSDVGGCLSPTGAAAHFRTTAPPTPAANGGAHSAVRHSPSEVGGPSPLRCPLAIGGVAASGHAEGNEADVLPTKPSSLPPLAARDGRGARRALTSLLNAAEGPIGAEIVRPLGLPPRSPVVPTSAALGPNTTGAAICSNNITSERPKRRSVPIGFALRPAGLRTASGKACSSEGSSPRSTPKHPSPSSLPPLSPSSPAPFALQTQSSNHAHGEGWAKARRPLDTVPYAIGRRRGSESRASSVGGYAVSSPSSIGLRTPRAHQLNTMGRFSGDGDAAPFAPPITSYAQWAVLAAAAMCHQHAILFLAIPIAARVVYMHCRGGRRAGLTALLLAASLLLAAGLCLALYYLLLSRVVGRDHVASWGLAGDEEGGVGNMAGMPKGSRYGAGSHLFLASVWRHFARGDYGSLSLHSGRGVMAGSGLSSAAFAHRAHMTADWCFQQMPRWVWAAQLSFVAYLLLFSRAVSAYGAAAARLALVPRWLQRVGTDGPGAPPPRRPLRAVAARTPTRAPPLSPNSPPSASTAALQASRGAAETPKSSGSLWGSAMPSSRGGGLFPSFPRLDSFQMFPATPSASPTTAARDFAEALTANGSVSLSSLHTAGRAATGECNGAAVTVSSPSFCGGAEGAVGKYTAPQIASFLPLDALRCAADAFGRRIIFWSFAFGVLSCALFNAMANIDLGDGAAVDSSGRLEIAAHVYHRFWLQSLLPFSFSIGVAAIHVAAVLMGPCAAHLRALCDSFEVFLGARALPLFRQGGVRRGGLCAVTAVTIGAVVVWWPHGASLSTLAMFGGGSPPLRYSSPAAMTSAFANAENEGDACMAQQRLAMVMRMNAAYGRSLLASLPHGAILITAGDQHLTAIRFQQHVLGYRRDVVHVDNEMAHYGWYREGLRRAHGVAILSPPSRASFADGRSLLDYFVRSPQPMPQRGTTAKEKGAAFRRLFALEDSSLIGGRGRWRKDATPVYHGWAYEVVPNGAGLRRRLCGDGRRGGGDLLVAPVVAVSNVSSSSSATESSLCPYVPPRNEKVYTHPLLWLPSSSVAGVGGSATEGSADGFVGADFFAACAPSRAFAWLRAFAPWEAAVEQHYALALKNALLAEAVRAEAGCASSASTSDGTSGGETSSGGKASSASTPQQRQLKALARKTAAALTPENFGEDVWQKAVVPFLSALRPFG